MKRILVAEDEAAIRELIAINLSRLGYEVLQAEDGLQAKEIFDSDKTGFDVVLLDIMMPGESGTEICKYIRQTDRTTGIIFLSAKTQEHDKVYGLLSGADDYITKPFSIRELAARIEVLCRRVEQARTEQQDESDDVMVGDFVLSVKKRAVFLRGEKIDLSQIEFEILSYLFANEGKTIARQDILNYVWGDNYYGDDKVVDVNIRRLRVKIEKDASRPEHLLTVWGKGYKWVR